MLWVLAAVLWTLMVVVQVRRANPLGWLDLRVYRDSVHQFVDGRPLYDIAVTEVGLPFTYPPVAIFLLAPLAWLPFPVAAGDPARAQRGRCAGRPAGRACSRCPAAVRRWRWRPRSAVAALFLRAGLVGAQLRPGRPAAHRRGHGGHARRARAGSAACLTGLLAAVKLTPLVFLLLLVLRRDWRAAAAGARPRSCC